MGRTNRKSTDTPNPWNRIGEFAPALASIGTVLGLVSYVFLRQMYVRFLDQINLRPEDLGLGYFDLLTGSVGALVFGVAIPVVGAGLSVYILFRRQLTWPVLFAVAVTLGVALVVSGFHVLGAPVLGIALWTVVPIRHLPRPPLHGTLQLLAIVGMGLALAVNFWFLLELGELSGRTVRFGGSPYEVKRFGLPFIGIRPTAVELRWIRQSDDKHRNLLPICPMLIGQHNGTAYVFDVLEGETVRLPSAQVTIRTPARPQDQALDRCYLERYKRQVAGGDAEEVKACLSDINIEGLRGSLDAAITDCYRKQLQEDVKDLGDAKFGSCVAAAVLPGRLAFNHSRVANCLIDAGVRHLESKIGPVDESAESCFRRAIIDVNPFAYDKDAMGECVQEQVQQTLQDLPSRIERRCAEASASAGSGESQQSKKFYACIKRLLRNRRSLISTSAQGASAQHDLGMLTAA